MVNHVSVLSVASYSSGQHWEIVGGETGGGIQVRRGEDLNSDVDEKKLSFKAVVIHRVQLTTEPQL